jgi:hypothetical protein
MGRTESRESHQGDDDESCRRIDGEVIELKFNRTRTLALGRMKRGMPPSAIQRFQHAENPS